MNLVLFRSERALRDTPGHDDQVLWLGANPIPQSLRSHAVAIPADPPAIEGWLAIRRLGDELIGGKSVKARLEFEGVSLWWFVHHWLLYGQGLSGWDERYRVLHRVVAGVASKPARMVLVSPRGGDDLVARAVAARHGIPYEWAVPAWSRTVARIVPGGRARALMAARRAKLLLRGLVARVVRRHPHPRVDLLFYTSSSTWDAARGTDRILGALIADAEDRGLTAIGLHLDYRRNLGLDTLFGLDRRIVAWESLVTPGLAWRAARQGRRIARSVREQFPGDVLGVPAAPLLADRLAGLGARLSDAVLAIETARRAIAALRPSCVYVLDGYDLWARALIVAAREAGIPSVEVQHGIIEENHSGYLHLDGEVAADRSQRSPYSPIPDTIAVHGDRAREALTVRGKYPPDSILVTGSPNIQAARRMPDGRHEMRTRLGLPDDAFVVLYFGAPRHVYPVDVEHLRAFLDCCRAMPSLKPLLRPHPGDQDRGRYGAAAAAAGIDAPVLTEPDPFELILAADAVISHNSTTALDAMALERAVIHINMSGSPDLFRFVEDGGALRATTAEELRAALVELTSPESRQRVVARQTPYAARYYAQCADPAGAMLEIGFPSLAKA